MSDSIAALQTSLAELQRRRKALEDTIKRRVGGDLQDWRHQVELRHHPEGYVTVDRRWSNPSMRAHWQMQALEEAEARFTEQRRAEVASELNRLDGKIARLQDLLPGASSTSPAPAVAAPTDRSPLHPTVAALALRVQQALPEMDRAWFPAWLAHRGDLLNASIASAFGDRLQLVELFAGIGGLGAGLERALDAVPVLQAEAVPERRQILSRNFSLALQVEDVHRLLELPAPCPPEQMVIAGGFPCRGMSQANLTGPVGFAHPQSGLWSVMIEVIRRWRPRCVVVENVVGLRARGLREVLLDLFRAGYDVLWGVARASDFGAPHERARLFGIGIRRDLTSIDIAPRPHRPEWLPWADPIPANDHRAPDQRARGAALGDCVVPVVAYAVGLVAARLIGGWRPQSARRTGDELPMNGWMENGTIYALPASPFVLPVQIEGQRWVQVDERFESPGKPVDLLSYPPAIGRIVWWDGESDNVDVELPGGEVMPFPPEWVKEKPWPTPTANDARNKGSSRQLERKGPGLNALCQTDCWIGGEDCPPELLLDYFSGRGAGPGLTEWMMGFPVAWTALGTESRSNRTRSEKRRAEESARRVAA